MQKVDDFALRAIINTEMTLEVPKRGPELLQRTVIGIVFKGILIYQKQNHLADLSSKTKTKSNHQKQALLAHKNQAEVQELATNGRKPHLPNEHLKPHDDSTIINFNLIELDISCHEDFV